MATALGLDPLDFTECILVIESEVEALAQQGKEGAAELGAGHTHTVAVIGATRAPTRGPAFIWCAPRPTRVSIV
jgi:hypothetical protein